RHHARTGRQLRRGPLRPDSRNGSEPACHLGGRCFMDQVRWSRTVQRSQRPRLRRGDAQVLVLIRPRKNGRGEPMIKKTLLPCLSMLAGLLIGAPAIAAVSAAEAAKLGNELTPLGGEKAAHAAGSI